MPFAYHGGQLVSHVDMPDRPPHSINPVPGPGSAPVVIATMLRPQGNTGVHTHFHQVLKYLGNDVATTTALVTPFSWGWPAYVPVYGVRRALDPVNGQVSVFWYRHWHEVFLRGALRNQLSRLGDCVIYAQDPPSARAALAARRDRGQRVVLAVHFRISQADEWAEKGKIPRNSWIFRNMRQVDRAVIPRVDRLVYVSRWAEEALTGWLPEAAQVSSAVIGNFVAPWHAAPGGQHFGDLVTVGHLEPVKNHRFLLRVLAEAKKAGHPLTLDIFGDGPLRKELERLALDLGLAQQVRFRGFRHDVRDFLPGYRAYVHASYSESSSLAIMEAMDAGLPIIAAAIGPLTELFDDGVQGRFWPLGDPAQAAAVLLELTEDESNRLKAAQAARERFARDFDANVVGPRLRSFLFGGIFS
jgi:glycosyltransferase involved in cell wall biosynthesis